MLSKSLRRLDWVVTPPQDPSLRCKRGGRRNAVSDCYLGQMDGQDSLSHTSISSREVRVEKQEKRSDGRFVHLAQYGAKSPTRGRYLDLIPQRGKLDSFVMKETRSQADKNTGACCRPAIHTRK